MPVDIQGKVEARALMNKAKRKWLEKHTWRLKFIPRSTLLESLFSIDSSFLSQDMHTGREDFRINSENILDKSSMFWIVATEILLTCRTDVKLTKDAKFCTMKLNTENFHIPKKNCHIICKLKSHESKESKLSVDTHLEREWELEPIGELSGQAVSKEECQDHLFFAHAECPVAYLSLNYSADIYLKSKAKFFGWMGWKPLLSRVVEASTYRDIII